MKSELQTENRDIGPVCKYCSQSADRHAVKVCCPEGKVHLRPRSVRVTPREQPADRWRNSGGSSSHTVLFTHTVRRGCYSKTGQRALGQSHTRGLHVLSVTQQQLKVIRAARIRTQRNVCALELMRNSKVQASNTKPPDSTSRLDVKCLNCL